MPRWERMPGVPSVLALSTKNNSQRSPSCDASEVKRASRQSCELYVTMLTERSGVVSVTPPLQRAPSEGLALGWSGRPANIQGETTNSIPAKSAPQNRELATTLSWIFSTFALSRLYATPIAFSRALTAALQRCSGDERG